MNPDAHRVVLVVAALIEDDQKRLLMVREAQPEFYGLWNQPAGHVEADESIADAFLREVKEETGHDVRIGEIASIHHFVDAAVMRFNIRGSLLAGEPAPLADDVLETGWFTGAELELMIQEGRIRSKRTELLIREWMKGETGNHELIRTIVETSE
jgi:ADP-ribose pyrophosphatase YjhB (NUDIX family)